MNKKINVIILLFIVFFLIGYDTFIVSPFIPVISKDLNVSSANGGYLVTMYSIFYVICSPILGPVSDRIGRKRMIAFGMAIFGAASIFTGLANNFFVALLSRGITGIGAAFAAPNVWAYIGDYFDYKERGKATAVIGSALSLGMIFGVPLASFLAQSFKWNYTFFLVGIISILAGVFIVKVLPSIKIEKTESKTEFSFKTILPAVIVTFFIAFSNFGIYTFLGYWLNRSFNLETSAIGTFMIAAGVGNLAGTQCGGYFGDKYKRKNVISISLILMTLSLIMLPFLNISIFFTGIDVFLWLAAGGAAFSNMQVEVTKISSSARGTIMGINNSFMWCGTAIGSAVCSIIINSFGFLQASFICALCALSAMIIVRFHLN